ncbi:MAG: hypothetical protein QOI93_5425 [Rhodospirillaceae bacterium]|jgi:hypothetical protein|nr:hypothetical protein [Rhodospirillaceae bacterium]
MWDSSDFRDFILRNAMAQAKLGRELARLEKQRYPTTREQCRMKEIKIDLMALNIEMNIRYQQEVPAVPLI